MQIERQRERETGVYIYMYISTDGWRDGWMDRLFIGWGAQYWNSFNEPSTFEYTYIQVAFRYPTCDIPLMFSLCWELLTGGKGIAAPAATPWGGHGQHPFAGADGFVHVSPCGTNGMLQTGGFLKGKLWKKNHGPLPNFKHQIMSHIVFLKVWC